jgi:hypothetical protein
MSSCPHCQQNTISPIAKFWSDAACPVRCSACGGLAYLPTHETTAINAIAYPGCFVVLAAVVFTNSLVPIYVWGGLWLAALGRVLWRAPLTAISQAQASENKRYGNIFIALLAGAGAIWWLVTHG